MKILLIEDEKEMRQILRQTLERENYTVESARNYREALSKVGVYEYDCILLDIGLPDGNGLEILKELKRQNKSDGVIIISPKNSLDDKLKGLNLGADDYLPKPFHMAELNARVKAVLRRKKFDGANIFRIANVEIETDNHKIMIEGEALELNRKEFDVFLYLCTN